MVHGDAARVAALAVTSILVAGCAGETAPTHQSSAAATTSMSTQAAGLSGTVVTPPIDPPSQVLRDTGGREFSLATQPAGEVTVLFFGYTHCPDVCPTTMADLAAARSQLPPRQRAQVAVVFVTEDPARDTPTALRRWLDRFDPSFVGLRGGNATTKAMLTQLHLPQTKRVDRPRKPIQHPSEGGRSHHHHGHYGVSHSGVVYAFAPRDRTLIYTGGTTPDEYTADFARLLTTSPQHGSSHTTTSRTAGDSPGQRNHRR